MRTHCVSLARLLLAIGLGACAAPRAPTKFEPMRGARVGNPCDDVRRGRECVRVALQKPQASRERTLALNESCRVGYSAACYFLVSDPKSDEDRVYYHKRACAFGRRGSCVRYAQGTSDDDNTREARWVKQITRLTPEDPTSVAMIAHPGAKLTFLEAEGDLAWAMAMQFELSSESRLENPVLVHLPLAALGKTEVPLDEPDVPYNARDFYGYIYGTPEGIDQSLDLQCGPLEVVAELPGGVQQLRQIHEGIEVRGYTREAIEWNLGTHTCWPRVTTHSSAHSTDTPLPQIPKGQVPFDAQEARKAAQYVRTGQLMYQVWFDDDGLECAEVTYTPGNIEIRPPPSEHKPRQRVSRSAKFSESGFAVIEGSEWIGTDEDGHGHASPCESYMTLLGESAEAIEYVEDRNILAFHPDDVSRWYKTKGACERYIAEHPHVRLTPGKRNAVAELPTRLLRGC